MSDIVVDDRAGSRELIAYLHGLPSVLGRLEYGDISFLGWGPEGRPVPVGIEYKTLGDVLKCVTDGRFAGHQLPGLISSYEDVWLLVEGKWRPDMNTGILQTLGHHRYQDAHVGDRRFTYRELDSWLMTMAIKGGIRVRTAQDTIEAAQFIRDLYMWWTQDGGWNRHKSHLAFDNSDAGDWRAGRNALGLQDRANLVKPGLVRRMAKELPGVGWDKSKAVASRFKTVREMAAATRSQWREIDGIGKKLAEEIDKALGGRK